jgi:hypothetical protein
MAEKITIAALRKKTDEELSDLLGFNGKIENFKKDLEKADNLDGKAKEIVERRIEEMFTPRPYVEDLKYTIDSAERQAKAKRTGKDEVCHCGCDILD